MVRHKVETISQLMGHGYWVRVLCRCGNNATLNPEKLLHSGKVGLSTPIDHLYDKLTCKLCRQRPYDVHFTFPPER